MTFRAFLSAIILAISLMITTNIGFAATAPANTQTNPNLPPTIPMGNASASDPILQQINYGVYQNGSITNTGFTNVLTSIKNLSDSISQLVSKVVDTSAHLMFTISPDLQTTMGTSYSQAVGTKAAVSTAFNTTNSQLNQLFNNTPYNQASLAQINALAKLTPIPINSLQNIVSANTVNNLAPFNLDSLLAPPVYSTAAEQANAQNFINFLSYQSLPYFNLSPNFFAKDYLSVQSYRAFLGTYAALQSIGLSNLNELYAERQPQPGLGQLAGITNGDGSASVLQVEQHMITQRGLNPAWYAQMENAPPATIQRETLYTMAAIQVELYKNNQLLQRILATQSAMAFTDVQLHVRPELRKLANEAQSAVQQKQVQQMPGELGIQ